MPICQCANDPNQESLFISEHAQLAHLRIGTFANYQITKLSNYWSWN